MAVDERTLVEREADAQRARANVEEFRADLEQVRADSAEHQANQNALRANAYATSSVRNSMAAEEARRERDFAETRAAIAERDANASAFGFWLLAGLILSALVIGIIWYNNRAPEAVSPTATTIIRNERVREVPVPANTQPAVVERPVAVPVPVDRPVPVTQPVPMPVPVPVPAQNNSENSAPAPATEVPAPVPAEAEPVEVPTSVTPEATPETGATTVEPGTANQ